MKIDLNPYARIFDSTVWKNYSFVQTSQYVIYIISQCEKPFPSGAIQYNSDFSCTRFLFKKYLL